jgi:hypothetical protein
LLALEYQKMNYRIIDIPFHFLLTVYRFLELGSTLEPGKPVKADKAAILSDATRMVIQLRSEAQQLKETNGSLEEKIKELKVIQPFLLNTVNPNIIHCTSVVRACPCVILESITFPSSTLMFIYNYAFFI